jgi:hypothetical protein
VRRAHDGRLGLAQPKADEHVVEQGELALGGPFSRVLVRGQRNDQTVVTGGSDPSCLTVTVAT